ncbi:hypothetical protein BPUTEOMOX_95 [methanotrophic endosymbiont of Bathymodiolus puteoserpentis (Logatchev)]|nr:hypothetical protein BPUTEOMOX_95 [methanotrophic endosymbiont of Bathymodiolus puteoserpentis (Logatchev)]
MYFFSLYAGYVPINKFFFLFNGLCLFFILIIVIFKRIAPMWGDFSVSCITLS